MRYEWAAVWAAARVSKLQAAVVWISKPDPATRVRTSRMVI